MALAVVSILLVVAFGSLSSISRSKKTLDDYQDVYLVAQSLLRRVTRELQLVTCEIDSNLACTRGKGIILPPDAEDGNAGATFLARSNQASKESQITFLAMEAGQYLPDSGARSGLVQITYRLAKEKADDELYSFVRDEIPYIFPAEEAYKKIVSFPVTKNVISFSFALYDRDSDSWTEEWGTKPSNTATLPTLIKFTLVMRSQSGIELPFETIVPVRAALQK